MSEVEDPTVPPVDPEAPAEGDDGEGEKYDGGDIPETDPEPATDE